MWDRRRIACPKALTIAFDAPGTGRSQTARAPMTIPAVARLIVRLLDELGLERTDVLGTRGAGCSRNSLRSPLPTGSETGARRHELRLGEVPGDLRALALLATPLRYLSQTLRGHEPPARRYRRQRRAGRPLACPRRRSPREPASLRGYWGQVLAGTAYRAFRGYTASPRHAGVFGLVRGSSRRPMASFRAEVPDGRLLLIPGEEHLLLLDPETAALPALTDFFADGEDSPTWREAEAVQDDRPSPTRSGAPAAASPTRLSALGSGTWSNGGDDDARSRRPDRDLRPRGGDDRLLAPPSRRGAARAARRARGVHRRAQDDGHPAAVPVGEPASRPDASRSRAARSTSIRSATPLRLDGGGLPMHGLLSAAPGWRVEHQDEATLEARFDFAADAELMAAFPFDPRAAHRRRRSTSGRCGSRPRSPRATRRCRSRSGSIPTSRCPASRARTGRSSSRSPSSSCSTTRCSRPGTARPSTSPPGRSATRTFDDAYLAPPAPFALEGGGRRIELAFEAGYPYAQVFAPPGDALIAFEPMTAPTNALVSGDLTPLEPGDSYRAVFAITVR